MIPAARHPPPAMTETPRHPARRAPTHARLLRSLAALALAWALGAPPSAAAADVAAVDVNTATVAELDGLKGIGPALSGRLLAARQAGGAFRGWADLLRRVKGIGVKSAARLSTEGLTVDGAPFDGSLSKK